MFSRSGNPFLTLLLSYYIWAITSGDLINRGQVKVTPGKNGLAGFANSVIPNIWIYDSFYVFEGGESIFDIIIELPCFGDLQNQGQLPVQEVLEGTDDCVL